MHVCIAFDASRNLSGNDDKEQDLSRKFESDLKCPNKHMIDTAKGMFSRDEITHQMIVFFFMNFSVDIIIESL